MTRRLIAAVLALCLLSLPVFAQTRAAPEPYGPDEFPSWARSLRRGEIIAVGLFPFVYFFSTFAFESGRFFAGGMDPRYAPGPVRSADGEPLSRNQKHGIILVSISLSMVLALVDHLIEGRK